MDIAAIDRTEDFASAARRSFLMAIFADCLDVFWIVLGRDEVFSGFIPLSVYESRAMIVLNTVDLAQLPSARGTSRLSYQNLELDAERYRLAPLSYCYCHTKQYRAAKNSKEPMPS